jgi:tetratricopeptide (TPR) repeat protein
MLPRLRHRWIVLIIALAVLILLRPTPIAAPLVASVVGAGQALSDDRPETALSSLDAAISFVPSNVSLYLHAARASLVARVPERGLAYLLAAEGHGADEATLDGLRGELLLALGDLRGATAAWENSEEAAPLPEEILRNLALTYMDLGLSTEAYNAFRDLVISLPNDLDALIHLGVLAAAEPATAQEFLEIAREHPHAETPLIRELISGMEACPGEESRAYCLAQVGQKLMLHDLWQLAEFALRGALDMNPDYADALAYHGLALHMIGRQGLPELMAAVNADPEAMLPHVLIGMYYLETGQPENALRELEIAVELDATNPAILAQLGAALDAVGEVDQALFAYRSAAALVPDNPDFWLLLAQYALSREIEIETLALPAARNAVALKPRNAEGLAALGYGHYMLGNFTMSERLLDKSVRIDSSLALTQYRLGLLRLAQGNLARARAALELAMMLDPDGAVGRMAELAMDFVLP